MSTSAVPRDLLLPPSQRLHPEFREQRKQKLKEHLLRKTFLAYKQENEILSSRDQRVMTSKGQVQEETNVLKLKTKMADKENVSRPTRCKNNLTMEKKCIPLKPSNELTTSTIAIDTHNLENNNETLQLLPNKDEAESQRMTLSQAFLIKNNNKKKQITTEKPKQDANMLKKLVLGSYRGQIVQSKVNSFRKPVQVKEESPSTTKKDSTVISKATKPQPINTNSVTVKSGRVSNMTTTKIVSITSQNRQLLRPPIRSHHNNTQDSMKRGNNRSSANATIWKGLHDKELLQLNSVLPSVKTSSSQELKKKTLSRSITSEIIARPASSSNTKLTEESKTIDQCRHTIAKSIMDSRAAQPKETAEERKARLNEWKAGKGRVLKRPPTSVVTQPKPEGQNERPVGSFWTTMAEEDEQRLFTEKVNKIVSGCLNLINEGCPKEEILDKLNNLIEMIPDAKKLVKYWICLARIEPLASPIENFIAIYEKAILSGAQPIEEMRHAIVDILTVKSQEKVKFGEDFEETCAAKEQIQEVYIEDNVVFQDCEEEQDDKTKDPAIDAKTPSKETRESCLIKYNVSTTPYLLSVKKKMQFDEINSTFKELMFLTPVRRSQRLQEKTSKLPDMLKDHYPCVSSLQQLTELGDDVDAFIYRPNAALCRMYTGTETTKEK